MSSLFRGQLPLAQDAAQGTLAYPVEPLWRRVDGTLSIGSNIVGQVGPEWELSGIGSFNADSSSDVLMRRYDGRLDVYNINNDRISGWANIGQVGTEWGTIGTGDFNA